MLMEMTMALQAGLAYHQANEANDQAKKANALSVARADSTNRIVSAQNVVAMKVDALSRWSQAVNNRLALKSGASALEANTANTLRRQDDRAGAAFSNSVQMAEQFGSQQAAAAASGVSGNVVGMIAGSMALRSSIVQENYRRAGITEVSDSQHKAGMIASQMINGLDHSILTPSINWNIAQPDVMQTQSNSSMLASAVLPAAGQLVKANGLPSMDTLKSLVSDLPTNTLSPGKQFTWDTSIVPGAKDPWSLWVSAGDL